MNNSRTQGSAHIVIIIILIAAILGGLGFVFWNRFITPKATHREVTVAKEDVLAAPKKSEMLIGNDDMNRYINYEKGFQFQFPKKISSNSICKEFNTRRDYYGNEIPSETHFGSSDGPVQMTILESGDEYIISPKVSALLSEPNGTDEMGYIFKKCDILPTTIELIEEGRKDNFGVKNIMIESRSFKVLSADSKENASQVTREIFKDQTGSVTWTTETDKARERGSFTFGPSAGDRRSPNFAYNLWYYPKEKKVVYINIGQSRWLQNVSTADDFFDSTVIDSFKFSKE